MKEMGHCAGLRILVADDHLVSRRYTVRALRQIGATVKAVDSAESALTAALAWRPDAIVTDIHLPGADGLELIRRIRRAWPCGLPPPRVIVHSADPTTPSGPPADADAILLKPASPAQLRTALGVGLLHRHPHTSRQEIGAGGASQARETEAGDGNLDYTAVAEDIQSMFQRELAAQLPALEASVAVRDLQRAKTIAHRLLASSRLCSERRLELSLQAFHSVCRDGAPAGDVAQEYYGLLAAARAWSARFGELVPLKPSGSTAASPGRPGPARRK